MRTPSIKGIAFREFIGWYELTRWREAMLRAIEALPLDLRFMIQPDLPHSGLLPGSWYPTALAAKLLENVTWGLDLEQRAALLREGVELAVGVTLTGVYRVLFNTLMNPERHAKYAQKIWDNYYNTGKVVGTLIAPGRAEQGVTDWSGHHPLLCELSIWSLTTFHKHMKCKNVKVSRSACILTGHDECRFHINWDA